MTSEQPGASAGVGHSSTHRAVPSPVINPSVLKTQACSQKQKIRGKHTHTDTPQKNTQKTAHTKDTAADNTVLDILTKMCTEINPQRNVLNYISRHKSPEHFKQAPKFGDLSTGIIKVCSLFPGAPTASGSTVSKQRGQPPPQKRKPYAFFVSQTQHKPQLSLLAVWP